MPCNMAGELKRQVRLPSHNSLQKLLLPLPAKVTLVSVTNFRDNPDYGTNRPSYSFKHYLGMSMLEAMEEGLGNELKDGTHRCVADAVTDHGNISLFYTWQTSNGGWYIDVQTMPSRHPSGR